MTGSDNSTDPVWLYNEFLVYFGLKLTSFKFLATTYYIGPCKIRVFPGSGLYNNVIVHFKRLGSRHIQKEIDIS